MLAYTGRDERILNRLTPRFIPIVRHFLEACWRQGIPAHLTQGFRTFAEQDTLYLQGVSNAKGGQSYHNYGLAFDIAFDNDVNTESLNDPYREPVPGAWEKCAEIGVRCGLEAGFHWKTFRDKPHYQVRLKRINLDDLRKAFLKDGMNGVEALLGATEKESFKLPPTAVNI